MKKTFWKQVILVALCLCLLISVSACAMVCESCGESPATAIPSKTGGETKHLCKACTPKCSFCSEKATCWYNSALGREIYVCDDCYEYIHDLNS